MNKFYTDKQKIVNWLDEYGVKNYTLVPDKQYGSVVNIGGDVGLSYKGLINIPVKFNEVTGNFWCHSNQLTSLEFCPKIVGGAFNCENNKLTSLEFCPKAVGGYFSCKNNALISLEFCPEKVGDGFHSSSNSELKEFQKTTDFKLIYLEHKKIVITKFSDKLNKELTNENSKKSAKIKI